MGTLRVKPWGDGQGDHVLIEESDFDPERHQLYEAPEQPPEQEEGDAADSRGRDRTGDSRQLRKPG
jgi:hypothetical protein